jgi:putative salt-induced outer membrane protein YdiY
MMTRRSGVRGNDRTENRHFKAAAATLGLLAVLANWPILLRGEEKKEGLLGPWKATAELSFVVTGGNTATSAFSLGTSFTRKWTNDTLLFKSYILKSNSTTTARTARGTETDFEIIEDKFKLVVAEKYMLAGQYDRRISKNLSGQVGLSWDRNRFAGVENRVMFTTGFGYAWVEKARTQVKTAAAMTYTLRQYVGQDMGSFAGLRFSVLADQKILDSSSVSTQFVYDDNLKRMKDWRFDWTNSVTASISKSLALKMSLRMFYTNIPALQNLALFDPDGLPTGLFVQVPLKKLDTFLTTSIVINF